MPHIKRQTIAMLALALAAAAGCAAPSSDDGETSKDALISNPNATRTLFLVDQSGHATRLDELSRRGLIACLEDACILEAAAAITIWEWLFGGALVTTYVGGSWWIQNRTDGSRLGPFTSEQSAKDYVFQAKKENEKVAGALRDKAREQHLPVPDDHPGADETYKPPAKHRDATKLPGGTLNGRSGVVDEKGQVWVKGPSRTKGQDFEWDVQTKGGGHKNVDWDGHITH